MYIQLPYYYYIYTRNICKTRSAYHEETLTGNARRELVVYRVLRPYITTGLPQGVVRSSHRWLQGPHPLTGLWQAGRITSPGRRDYYMARENGCACRYTNRRNRSLGRHASEICLWSKQELLRRERFLAGPQPQKVCDMSAGVTKNHWKTGVEAWISRHVELYYITSITSQYITTCHEIGLCTSTRQSPGTQQNYWRSIRIVLRDAETCVRLRSAGAATWWWCEKFSCWEGEPQRRLTNTTMLLHNFTISRFSTTGTFYAETRERRYYQDSLDIQDPIAIAELLENYYSK